MVDKPGGMASAQKSGIGYAAARLGKLEVGVADLQKEANIAGLILMITSVEDSGGNRWVTGRDVWYSND